MPRIRMRLDRMDKRPEQTRLTERLRLEPIGLQHVDDLLCLHSDPAVAKWHGGTWSAEYAQAYARKSFNAWKTVGIHKWLAFDRMTDKLVGRGGLSIQEVDGAKQVEVGWTLHSNFWGHGYATEIGRTGLEFAFTELGAWEVIAYTESHNMASRAVMERLGMRYARTFKERGLIEGCDGVHDGAEFVIYRISIGDASDA